MRLTSWHAPLVLALAACTGGGAERDASVDARVFVCEAPLSTALSPSTRPPNVGLPTASIAGTADGCALYDDEGHPDALLFVADTAGTWFDTGLIAQTSSGWSITESSTGDAHTTYLRALPRETDIRVVLASDGRRVELEFRIDGGTLTLLAMHEL